MSTKRKQEPFFLRKILETQQKEEEEYKPHWLILQQGEDNTVCALSLLLVVSRRMTVTHQYSRSCRRLERNNGWFSTVWSRYSTKRFKKTFRVSRETFGFILSRIRHVLERDTINEEPISPECRLAICLYRLSRGDYYYTIAEMTGLGVSTVCTICKEVTRAMVENVGRFHEHAHAEKGRRF